MILHEPPARSAPADARRPADDGPRHALARRARESAPGLLLAAALIWLGFNAGGFFAGTSALAATVVGAALVLWITLASRPFARLTPVLGAAAAALGLLAVWTLLSATWGIGTAARALLEFDRTLLYLLVVLLAGLAVADRAQRRGLVRGLVVGAVIVAGAGLVTRLLPDVWPVGADVQADRLSYPVTYWNTLGLLSLVGLLAALHVTADENEPRWSRIAAAAAWPVLALALFFTFSRAAMGLLPVGAVLYLLLARPRGTAGALLAVVAPTAVALAAGWGADALTSAEPAGPAAIDEGRALLPVVLGCVAAAAVLRLLTERVDRAVAARLAAVRVPRPALFAAAGAAVLVLAGTAIAADAPGRLADAFSSQEVVSNEGDRRGRLTELGNNGRLDQWDIALEGFRADALKGVGAGTYALTWTRERPYGFNVVDAHSLYAEILGELGLVGLLLVVAALGALLVGTLRAARGPDRALGALAATLVAVYAVRAGIDWDWEMPVVTLPVLALAAATLAARDAGGRALRAPQFVRVVVALGVLVLLVSPVLVWQSQARLDDAVAALRAGDCPRAVDRALAATSVLKTRPEPFEVLGYCDARLGEYGLAVDAFKAALERDPEDWRLHYGLAVVRAAYGQDPRPRLLIARRQNPRGDLIEEALELMDTDDPREWRRRASRARLPL